MPLALSEFPTRPLRATSAEKKQGIGINDQGQWGYHPLVVTLANTREPLFIANRNGNRSSHENSAFYFDKTALETMQRRRAKTSE